MMNLVYTGYAEDHLMSKKCHYQAGQLLRKLNCAISCLFNGGDDDSESRGKLVLEGIMNYLKMTPRNRKKLEHMEIFEFYGMPVYLFALYNSPVKNNKEIAEKSIRLLLYPNIQSFPIPIQHRFASMILEFCKRFRKTITMPSEEERLLYDSCRQTFESLLVSIGPTNTRRFFCDGLPQHFVRMFSPFIREATTQLVMNMKLIRESCFCKVASKLKSRFKNDINDFSILTLHMCTNIEELLRVGGGGLSLDLVNPMASSDVGMEQCVEELKQFYVCFSDLLDNIDAGLTCLDGGVESTRCIEQCKFNHGWSYYLSILKELDKISKLYHPAAESLSSCLNSHRDSINKLIMNSKRGDDHQWLLGHKNLLNSESRRHLITMTLPDQEVESGDHLQVIIDKSKLFVDSLEHVGLANPISLRKRINLQFKNEVAAGSDVFEQWLLLICQHLFSPRNSLFVSSPQDPHRIYPSPATVDSQQLEYYRFCGRLIALAWKHDVRIGIGFDRLFFLQLARRSIVTLEDIRDAYPHIYNSCKDILEMDNKFVDSDGLGVTFVKSIAEKVKLFVRGVDDILTRRCRKKLFESIELEDLDYMLLGRTKDGDR